MEQSSFSCSTSAISALLAALRIPAWEAAPIRWRRGCRNKREKKEVWQNQNLQRWTCLHMFRQVPHPRKVRLHPKVRGYSQLRRNMKARWEEIRNPTQRRVLKRDCKMRTLAGWWMTATEKPVATKEESGDVDLSESETGSEEEAVTERPIACRKATVKPYASRTAERIEWSHNLHTSPATVHHMEAVLSIVRNIYKREHDDPMNDLDVHMAIWGVFMNVTLRAAVHLGQDCEANLRYVKNHIWNSVGQLFNETGKLINEQKEISGENTIMFKDSRWMSTSLLCNRAYAKVENWSANKKKSPAQGLSISKMRRACRQACCVQRLIGSPTPKSTSSPTLCDLEEHN